MGWWEEEEDDDDIESLLGCANQLVTDLLEIAVEDYSDEAIQDIWHCDEAALVLQADSTISGDELEEAIRMTSSPACTGIGNNQVQPAAPASPRTVRNPRRSMQQTAIIAPALPPSSPPTSARRPRMRGLTDIAPSPPTAKRHEARGSGVPASCNIERPCTASPGANVSTRLDVHAPAREVAAPPAELQPVKTSPRRSLSAASRSGVPSAMAMDLGLAPSSSPSSSPATQKTKAMAPEIDWTASLINVASVAAASASSSSSIVLGCEPSLWAQAHGKHGGTAKGGFLPKLPVASPRKADWSLGVTAWTQGGGTAQRRFSRSVF